MSSTALITRELTDRIRRRAYPYGAPIPSERALAETYRVSRSTIRRAIAELTAVGLLKRVQGKGTFPMKTDFDDAAVHFKGMSELLSQAGYDASSHLLRTQTRHAGHRFSEIFSVRPDEEIFQITRLRLGNGQPISIESAFTRSVFIERIDRIDFQVYSLYDAFRINHLNPHTIDQVLSSTRVHTANARMLGAPDNTPVMSLEITARTRECLTIEYTEVLVLPDFCKYYTDSIIVNGVYSINYQEV